MRLISWNVNGLRAVMKKGFEGIFLSLNAGLVVNRGCNRFAGCRDGFFCGAGLFGFVFRRGCGLLLFVSLNFGLFLFGVLFFGLICIIRVKVILSKRDGCNQKGACNERPKLFHIFSKANLFKNKGLLTPQFYTV